MNLFLRMALVTALTAPFTAGALTFGVTEGVTYRASDKEIEAKFEPIAQLISKAVKQPVSIRVISSYKELRDALRKQEIDVAYVHPAHVALEAVKTGAYHTVAWTAGSTEYKVSFLCKDGKPLENWASINGKALVTPDPDSITAVMTRAMLREKSVPLANVRVQTTRFQDAVPFYVEQSFADYGATASKAVIKDWKEKGGKICTESRAVPIKNWIASTKLDATVADSLREMLIGMDKSDAGKRALSASGYAALVPASADTEKGVMNWLGI
jgi:phosphonate transport system substrate-binding protein